MSHVGESAVTAAQESWHRVLVERPYRHFGIGQPRGFLLQPQALRDSAEIGGVAWYQTRA